MVVVFRVGGSGGTTVRLNEPSNLEFDGERITAANDGETIDAWHSPHPFRKGVFYRVVRSNAKLKSVYNVRWTRADGTKQNWEMKMPKAIKPLIVNNKGRVEISWQGAPLEKDENVRARLTVSGTMASDPRKTFFSFRTAQAPSELSAEPGNGVFSDILRQVRADEVPDKVSSTAIRTLVQQKSDMVDSKCEYISKPASVSITP